MNNKLVLLLIGFSVAILAQEHQQADSKSGIRGLRQATAPLDGRGNRQQDTLLADGKEEHDIGFENPLDDHPLGHSEKSRLERQNREFSMYDKRDSDHGQANEQAGPNDKSKSSEEENKEKANAQNLFAASTEHTRLKRQWGWGYGMHRPWGMYGMYRPWGMYGMYRPWGMWG